MFGDRHPGIGNLIQSLSKRMDEMQREIAGLRQDVRTLTFLVREQRGGDNSRCPPCGEENDSRDESQEMAE